MLTPLTDQELQHYFARISYSSTASTDLATLQALHALHPVHIAFENLNSWCGQPVSLAPAEVFNKLVTAGRGGYCFEQNQLFLRVLHSLGFTVQGLSARVRWMLPENVVLPRTHKVLLVSLHGQRYLTDVGFGGVTLTAALDLDSREPQQTPHEQFAIAEQHGNYTVSVCIGHSWQDLYSFSLDPYLPIDYETANWYVSTHPKSRFVNELIACRADEQGRHTLLNNRYARYLPGQVPDGKEYHSSDELLAVLQEQFRINIASVPDLGSRISRMLEACVKP